MQPNALDSGDADNDDGAAHGDKRRCSGAAHGGKEDPSGAVASGAGTVVVVRDNGGGGVSDGDVAASVPVVADTPRS